MKSLQTKYEPTGGTETGIIEMDDIPDLYVYTKGNLADYPDSFVDGQVTCSICNKQGTVEIDREEYKPLHLCSSCLRMIADIVDGAR